MAYCHSFGSRVPWRSKYATPLFTVSELSAVMALSTSPLAIKALGPSSLVTMNILNPPAAATPSDHASKCGGRLPTGPEYGFRRGGLASSCPAYIMEITESTAKDEGEGSQHDSRLE